MKLGLWIDRNQRRDSAQEPYYYLVYLLSYLPFTIVIKVASPGHLGKYKKDFLPLTIYVFIFDAYRAISWKVQNGLRLNLVHT